MTDVEQLHAVIDRIADADARRDAALSDRAAAVDELHQLLATEQPEQRTDGLQAGGTRPAAPVSKPKGVGKTTEPPAHEADDYRGEAGYNSHGRARIPVRSSPAASSTTAIIACPECGAEVKPKGLGSHQRKHKPGYVGPKSPDRHRTPIHPVNGTHPSRNEKFLCSRCSAPFLTRELRDAHQAEANCSAIPPRPPMGRAPLGPLSGPGAGDGFGQ